MHLLVLSAFRPNRAARLATLPQYAVSMHLLVLSAFRPGNNGPAWAPFAGLNAPFGAQCFPTCAPIGVKGTPPICLNAPFGAQCFPTNKMEFINLTPHPVSMHLLVLSAFRLGPTEEREPVYVSQCTFWCSVLSDKLNVALSESILSVSMHLLVLSAFRPACTHHTHHATPPRLNAPFGAQCFPTVRTDAAARASPSRSQCTFWCSVLSDLERRHGVRNVVASQCTFWCSVLSDRNGIVQQSLLTTSQCTFWCSVLSDALIPSGSVMVLVSQCTFWCSVLSDSGLVRRSVVTMLCLNAPFGAQCFPTLNGHGTETGRKPSGLNAPFGAQCFPTYGKAHGAAETQSQCTFWCSVLSDGRGLVAIIAINTVSQCTFWCSVLSDRLDRHRRRVSRHVSMHLLVLSAFRRSPRAPPHYRKEGLNAPFGAQCFPTNEIRGVVDRRDPVSMHLLVLSAFRPDRTRAQDLGLLVSMHLLVLSAFRLRCSTSGTRPTRRLNAPFGAQCFPTIRRQIFPIRL